MENCEGNEERSFSIELKSKAHLKNIRLTDGSSEGVLIDGVLGKLEHAGFAEGLILEVVGSNGVLRMDVRAEEIKKTAEKEVE